MVDVNIKTLYIINIKRKEKRRGREEYEYDVCNKREKRKARVYRVFIAEMQNQN